MLASYGDASVHAVVSDPDYGIPTGAGRDAATIRSGWEMDYAKMQPIDYQRDCARWAAECWRVAVPGAWLVALGSWKTAHRMAAGFEDAGWEIRDVGWWRHNQGQMLGAGTKEYDGNGAMWSTKLRPVSDPIVFARKRFKGTHAALFERHGTGLLNITALKDSLGVEKWPTGEFCFPKSKGEAPLAEDGTPHSTVKPLALMRALVSAVTPTGGIVLDPCMGSGTTVEAALLEGFRAVGIDRVPEFVRMAEQRVARVPR